MDRLLNKSLFFATEETAAILVHSLHRFSMCTKMSTMAVAKLLLCCDSVCKAL